MSQTETQNKTKNCSISQQKHSASDAERDADKLGNSTQSLIQHILLYPLKIAIIAMLLVFNSRFLTISRKSI